MAFLFRLRGLAVVALMFAAGISSQTIAAGTLQLNEDGWHRWQVSSVKQHADETIFVLIMSGKAKDIEIAGHWCNGHRHEQAIDHGLLSTDESIDWLQQHLDDPSSLRSDAIAAISMHAGDRPLQILIDIVESDADHEIREEAVFWMAMSESDAAFDYIDKLLMAN